MEKITNLEYNGIVIGAGIIGASCAYHLASRGYRVLVLDRNAPGSGASGGNLGQISLSDRLDEWHMDLSLKSQAYYRKVLSREYDTEYAVSGGSAVIMDDEQQGFAERCIEKMKGYGLESFLYKGEDIRKGEPEIDINSIQALLHVPAEGKLNPFLTTLAFLDKAEKAGAVILGNTPVTGFEKTGNTVTGVITPNGVFRSEWVLNCTGPRAAHVGRLAGVVTEPLKFHKGTAFVSEPVRPVIRGPIVGGGFLFPEEPGAVRPKRHIGFATVQTAHGSILIAQSTEECETDDVSVNMPSLALVAGRFLKHYPQLHDLQIVRAWAATTTYTSDALPVFGFSGNADNFLTVAGFKGAFTTAPAIGEKAADAVEGRIDEVFRTFSPDR